MIRLIVTEEDAGKILRRVMQIQVLGAHNTETLNSKYISLLVDGILVIDAGGLTSSLTVDAQKKIKAVLLTHKHFDHVRDIPALAINLFFQNRATSVYGTRDIYQVLSRNLLNDEVYPNYFKIPEANSTLIYHEIYPGKITRIEDYIVLPVKMNHKAITVGYQITSQDNKTIFYTADTGKGLAHCWQQISPQLLFIEVTLPNSHADFAIKTNHLTPAMVEQELSSFRKIKGYVPSVIALHMKPDFENQIKAELAEVSRSLNLSIQLAYEGMVIHL